MIEATTLRLHIRSTLSIAGLWSDSKEELMLGIAAHESHLGVYKRNWEKETMGIYQMNYNMLKSIWAGYIDLRPSLAVSIHMITGVRKADEHHLEYNLAYQTLMECIKFLWMKTVLPPADNIRGLAEVWYNCKNHDNETTLNEFINNYNKLILQR